MLDTSIRKTDAAAPSADPHPAYTSAPSGEPGALRRAWTSFRASASKLPFSRLTWNIIVSQLLGLSILLIGSLQINEYRDGLIEAKLEGVRAQAQVVSSIIAYLAAEDADCGIAPGELTVIACDVALNEERVNAIFTRVWPNLAGRVRVFETPEDFDGRPIENARDLLLQDKVLRSDAIELETLPEIGASTEPPFFERMARSVADTLLDTVIDPGLRPAARERTLEQELHQAFLTGAATPDPGVSSLRYNEDGELVASVSIPIRKVQAVYGVVTAEIGGIEEVLQEARGTLMNFFVIALIVSVLLSILLTMTIADPIRKLANAADRVRDGIRGTGRMRIPDFPRRRDEIGELSDSLKSMTQALYDRIEVIDNFAADVSHELKNPLTSIRSAVETLDLAKTEQARDRLLDVIKNDVSRMDRLITDISNATRLDADLAREGREAVDVIKLLSDIVDTYNTTAKPGRAPVRLLGRADEAPLYIFGSPHTLGQVFRNLIDNALSFSPADGTVRVTVAADRGGDAPTLHIDVADDGPGIPSDNLESIFNRFYTRRPAGTAFGNNSGLGLAICRQVVDSHGGRIWAENRTNARDEVIGAIFRVRIPLQRTS